MAFGAFKGGNSQNGGSNFITSGGLSDMFANLSSGLFAIGKSKADEEGDERKQKHADAQTAAQHAFEMNLARFNRGAAKEQMEAQQAHVDVREDIRDATNNKRLDSQEATANRRADQQEKFQSAELGIRGAEVGIRRQEMESRTEERKAETEKFHASVEAAKAAAARGEAKDAAAIAEKSLEPYKAQVSQAQAAFNAVSKVNDPDSVAYKSAQHDLADATSVYESENKKFGSVIDKALKDIGYGSDKTGAGVTSGVSAEEVSGFSPRDDGLGKSAVPADRKAVIDAYIKQGASPEQATQHVNALPQSAIDKALGKPPQADAAPPSQDFMPPSDGSQSAPPQMASAPPPEAAAPPASAAPDAPPQLASAAGPPGQASDPNAQYQEMAQKLQQSPDGQGTLTTLDRLASAPAGPIADKMRRAAQNSLTEQFPDADPDAFIGSYLQQQQQEPEQTETA